MHRFSPLKISAIACAAVLAACGGDGNDPAPADATKVAGQVFKGPTSGASVCVYAVNAGAKGAKVAAQSGSTPAVADGCVVTGADGSYNFILPAGTRGELLVESSGGTYCSDESNYNGSSCAGGGTPVAMGANPMKAVVAAPASGTVNAPLTLLTTAAVQAAPTLGTSAFQSAYGTIAANFNAPTDPATSPASGDLTTALKKLAVYVGTSTSDLADIVSGIAAGTLVATNTTFPVGIEFAVGADQKTARLFTVSSTGATQVSTASLPGIPGSYARSGSTVTVTMPFHNLRDGMQVPLQFAAGTGGTATSGTYRVTLVDDNTFTVTDTASGTITGGTLYRDPVTKLAGSYTQVSGDSHVTVTIPSHGLESGDGVDLKFTSGGASDISSSVGSVIDANTVTVSLASAATANASGNVDVRVGTNYSSFDTVMHPSGKWLYVASGYECWNGSPFCWGGDVITTFRIDWQRGKLTLVGAQRTGATWSRAIPVKMAINAAGTRMVHQDDDLDGLVLWNIDTSTGALSRVADSGSSTTNNHGVAFSADGNYVYNGASVFTLSASAITSTASGTSGNGGDVVDNVLFFARPSNGLTAYSIVTPGAPTLLTQNSSVTTSRDLSTRNGSLILSSGPGGIASYTFNGSVIAAAAPAQGAGVLQRDGSGTLASSDEMYRSVNLNKAGNLAVASYFTVPGAGSSVRGGPPSGYLFATVGADGQLTRISDASVAQYARSAKFIKQP